VKGDEGRDRIEGNVPPWPLRASRMFCVIFLTMLPRPASRVVEIARALMKIRAGCGSSECGIALLRGLMVGSAVDLLGLVLL
jgi:hypothetical protein